MNFEIRNMIDSLTHDVIKTYNIQIPITDMKEVVHRLGGVMIEDENVSGYSEGFVKKSSNGFEIIIPRGQIDTRKNFTIAHEIGHLFMHMGYQIDTELWNSQDNLVYHRYGNSDIELQANEFAAALLMPKEEYKKVMDANTVGNSVYTHKIANHFNVSIDAAAYRGKWLGYLQW